MKSKKAGLQLMEKDYNSVVMEEPKQTSLFKCLDVIEYDKQLRNMSFENLINAFKKTFKGLHDKNIFEDRALMEVALAYKKQQDCYEEQEVKMPAQVKHDTALALACKKTVAYNLRTRTANNGGNQMKNKKNTSKKSTTKKGPSICSRMIELLSQKLAPSNDKIVALIKGEFDGTKFDSKHLAWYKNKFRKGELTGMNGEEHTIKQAEDETKKVEKAEAPKKSTTKTVAKGKATNGKAKGKKTVRL